MSEFRLTEKELRELRIAHRSCKNRRYAYRLNAIILLGTGWSNSQVSAALLLDEETVRKYQKQYTTRGISELLRDDRHGSECRLTELERNRLEEELEKQIYPTTQSIIAYVEKAFTIRYTQSGMRDLLHRMGYAYKKPKLVPGNPDKEAQELFAKQYDEFMLNKPSDVEVLFADAVHPEHNGMAAYGWIKRGQIRELKTNSGRERLNLHGAMNADTYQVTVIESTTVNYESTLNLFQTLEQTYPFAKTIFMIVDNARYHFAKQVKAYLSTSRIQLVPLPSYSPNLNLIERLWKFFKKKVLYNRYYENITVFRKACIQFFRNIADVRDEMIAFIGHEFELE